MYQLMISSVFVLTSHQQVRPYRDDDTVKNLSPQTEGRNKICDPQFTRRIIWLRYCGGSYIITSDITVTTLLKIIFSRLVSVNSENNFLYPKY